MVTPWKIPGKQLLGQQTAAKGGQGTPEGKCDKRKRRRHGRRREDARKETQEGTEKQIRRMHVEQDMVGSSSCREARRAEGYL